MSFRLREIVAFPYIRWSVASVRRSRAQTSRIFIHPHSSAALSPPRHIKGSGHIPSFKRGNDIACVKAYQASPIMTIYQINIGGIFDDDLLRILEVVQMDSVVEREGGWDAVREWRETLSGGDQQKIAWARLFYHNPKVSPYQI